MKGVWKRRGRALMPASTEAEDALSAVRDGTECMGEIRTARHPKQHRTFFKVLGVLVDHDVFTTKEAALDAVKIGLAHVDTLIMPDTGEVFYTPRSIAFESMAQADFSAFMDAAIKLVCDRWLAGADREAMRAEVFDVLDGPAAIGRRLAA